MVYDDLKIAIERRKRLKAEHEIKKEVEWKEFSIANQILISLPNQVIEMERSVIEKRYRKGEQEITGFFMPNKESDFLFFCPIWTKESVLIGSFHCREEAALYWKPVYRRSIQSIKELEKTDES